MHGVEELYMQASGGLVTVIDSGAVLQVAHTPERCAPRRPAALSPRAARRQARARARPRLGARLLARRDQNIAPSGSRAAG
eukprot:3626600-Prymnesium_polylepis.1